MSYVSYVQCQGAGNGCKKMGKRRVQKSFGNFRFSSIKFRSRTEFFGFIRKRRGGEGERKRECELTILFFWHVCWSLFN